jgi:hypothetical protein
MKKMEIKAVETKDKNKEWKTLCLLNKPHLNQVDQVELKSLMIAIDFIDRIKNMNKI